jgi:hypothetical protein
VFTTELGGPVDPRNLLRVIEVAAKAAGVEGVGVSPETFTVTRATTRRGPLSMDGRVRWGCRKIR